METSNKKHSILHWVAVAFITLFLIGLALKTMEAILLLGGTRLDLEPMVFESIYIIGAMGIIASVFMNIFLHQDLD